MLKFSFFLNLTSKVRKGGFEGQIYRVRELQMLMWDLEILVEFSEIKEIKFQTIWFAFTDIVFEIQNDNSSSKTILHYERLECVPSL